MSIHISTNFFPFKKPDEVVPLASILKVTEIDNQADPYQFKVFIEVKKIPVVWTLKAQNEVGQCLYPFINFQFRSLTFNFLVRL